MKKLIRYRIPVSIVFPATHDRKGERTSFICKILHAINFNEAGNGLYRICSNECGQACYRRLLEPKLHTIRASELWVKRFEKINKGEAVLELYYWSGKPYKSKSVTICQLGKDDGIGIQSLKLFRINTSLITTIEGSSEKTTTIELAKNDGLSLNDFKVWFRKYDLSKPLFIIHFTKFRY